LCEKWVPSRLNATSLPPTPPSTPPLHFIKSNKNNYSASKKSSSSTSTSSINSSFSSSSLLTKSPQSQFYSSSSVVLLPSPQISRPSSPLSDASSPSSSSYISFDPYSDANMVSIVIATKDQLTSTTTTTTTTTTTISSMASSTHYYQHNTTSISSPFNSFSNSSNFSSNSSSVPSISNHHMTSSGASLLQFKKGDRLAICEIMTGWYIGYILNNDHGNNNPNNDHDTDSLVMSPVHRYGRTLNFHPNLEMGLIPSSFVRVCPTWLREQWKLRDVKGGSQSNCIRDILMEM